MPQSPKKLTDYQKYALKLITLRPRTSQEIIEKLMTKGSREQESLQIVERLKELKLHSEQDTADWIVRAALNHKLKGFHWIKARMNQLSLDPNIASQVLVSINQETETQAAISQLQKKAKTLSKYEGNKLKQKLDQHLASRGFRAEAKAAAIDDFLEKK